MNIEHEIVLDIEVSKKIIWNINRTVKRKIGVRYDIGAFFEIMDNLGITLGDYITNLNKHSMMDLIPISIYVGHQRYCYKKNALPDYTREEIMDMINTSVFTSDHYQALLNLWNDFMKDFSVLVDNNKKKMKENR